MSMDIIKIREKLLKKTKVYKLLLKTKEKRAQIVPSFWIIYYVLRRK